MRKRKTRCCLLWSILLGIVLSLYGCAEVPVTHRKGLRLVPNSELLSMSLQQYGQVIKEAKLSTDQAKVRMVRRVGERVAPSAEAFLKDAGRESQIERYQWEFNLIEDDKMARASYDPREAVPFRERMNKAGGAGPPAFLSTHPAPESRITNIQSHMSEALTYVKKYQGVSMK